MSRQWKKSDRDQYATIGAARVRMVSEMPSINVEFGEK
jgi:hypothetical protein